jgi:hypothetical protein
MIAQFNRTLLLTATLALTLASASGQIQLTDISLFSADAAGNYAGPDIWETLPDQYFVVWVQSGAPGGPFLNGPTSANAQPNISLPLGTSSFTLMNAPGADFASFGINLFFNGSLTPSISATGPMLTSQGGQHTFSPDNASFTPSPGSNGIVPGAGTLTAEFGNELVTLTDFYLATPSVYNLDQAGEFSTGPAGSDDYVGGITFSVTSVPEPQWSLWATGLLAGLIAMRRRVQQHCACGRGK